MIVGRAFPESAGHGQELLLEMLEIVPDVLERQVVVVVWNPPSAMLVYSNVASFLYKCRFSFCFILFFRLSMNII